MEKTHISSYALNMPLTLPQYYTLKTIANFIKTTFIIYALLYIGERYISMNNNNLCLFQKTIFEIYIFL